MQKYANVQLQKAIAEYGAAKLARDLGLPKTTVESWKTRGVPERRRQIVVQTIQDHIEKLRGYLSSSREDAPS